MKTLLQKLFSPILNLFEPTADDQQLLYKPSHRTILLVVGVLFSGLATVAVVIGLRQTGFGFLFPALIFGGAGLVSLVVGCLGSDQAVAKLWGSRY